MSSLHSVNRVFWDKLSARDLDREAHAAKDGGLVIEAYRALAAKPDGTPEAQALDVLVIRSTGRVGVAWGSDAKWADIGANETAEELVRLYLEDGEAFEGRA